MLLQGRILGGALGASAPGSLKRCKKKKRGRKWKEKEEKRRKERKKINQHNE